MKKISIFLFVCLCCLFVSAQELTVGSYFINCGDQWSTCSKSIAKQLNWERPDMFGTQDCTRRQVVTLQGLLDGYQWIGVGATDGQEQGKYAAIFYRPERVQLLKQGTFWLNETPDTPAVGWDATTPRICTWGLFRDRKTKREFYYLNVQMDEAGTTARSKSAELVMQRIAEMTAEGNKSVILTGGFHIPQTDQAYRLFTKDDVLKDCYTSAAYLFAENGTDNQADYHLYTDQRSDHIFVTAQTTVNAYAVLTDGYWTGNTRHTLSTHYPLFARIVL